MKKFILAALLALPLTALAQSSARAGGCGDCCTPLYRVGISVGLVFRGWCGCDYSTCKQTCNGASGHCGGGGGGGGGCFPGGGPWYGAWPYSAHFQTPAPTGYPYWPAPMGYGAGFSAAPAPAPAYAGTGPGMEPYGLSQMPTAGNFGGYPMSGVQTAGYGAQAPAYWYPGR
jgi:hypothetical protein